MRTFNQAKIVLAATIALSLLCSSFAFSVPNPTRTIRQSISSIKSRTPKPTISSSPALFESTASDPGIAFSSYSKVDWAALVKYPVGLAVQMSLIFGLLTGIDKLVAHFALQIPMWANIIFFYAFNIKSSLFSIMPNKRSDQRQLKQEDWEYNKRNKPSWTPPGIVFGIMWPLFTFGLRAVTASMVVETMGGKYASAAIMSLVLHWGMGNLWNTANNVERRLGLSVILLYGLWLTKAFAAFQFYKVNPLAGKLLALTMSWLTAAAALETRTWQINPDPDTGKKEPLVPMQHPKWATKFRWEQ